MAPIFTGSKFGFGRGAAIVSSTFSATGGDVNALAPGNGFTYHTFTSTGPATFTVNSGTGYVEVLMVAAGGGTQASSACCQSSGGGGAGGILWGYIPVSPGTYPISVGAGSPGASGGNTTLVTPGPTTYTAYGGGNGTQYIPGPAYVPASTGGSCGGGGAGQFNNAPGSPTQTSQQYLVGYGNVGGNFSTANPGGYPDASVGGGGGGAGTAGVPGSPQENNPIYSGNGGDGKQFPAFTGSLIGVPSLSPLNGYFAGGGGGGCRANFPGPATGGSGGQGGGGAGAPYTGSSATNGTTNSGGGGGGPAGGNGGSNTTGGPGIVCIRYQISGLTANPSVSGSTFTVDEVLIVGGGGGGGRGFGGGGGGAGGFRSLSNVSLLTGVTYDVIVGAGGNGAPASTPNERGLDGGYSLFANQKASGGGGGGSGQGPSVAGAPGGSSGGSSSQNAGGGTGNPTAGNRGGYTPSEGNAGGSGWGDPASAHTGGGGGGAGGAGSNSTPGAGGAGGPTTPSSITGSPVVYCGGGGGGGIGNYGRPGGSGGGAGAGAGAPGPGPGNGDNASIANRGSGGGGGGTINPSTSSSAGNGSSGVVIVAVTSPKAPQVTVPAPVESGKSTARSGYTVYTFNSSGTILFS